ncbi:MAG TPA: DUF397 domain-containing protein [Actinocrinis sp.]|jgi:hypothetical protein
MKRETNAGGWFKSSFCKPGPNECVEVAIGPDEIGVRDSKDRSGGRLTFTRAEWTAFLAGVRAGEFDPR